MTKNIVIQVKNDLKAFQDNMNVINEEFAHLVHPKGVFATQTHVTPVSGGVLYTAVFFVRE